MTVQPSDYVPEGVERRVAPRTRTLKSAKIYFNNRFSTFDCVVRNISSTGALLTLDEAVHLPKTFEVRVGEDSERPARLVYRRGMFAGIHFLDVSDSVEVINSATTSEAEWASLHNAGAMGAFSAQGEEIVRLTHKPLPDALTRNFKWY